jgi:pimeloyl-ACP methyl ester carboxylesterase
MGHIVEMPLPRLGETMEEGRIALLVKKPGEKFRRGETILEVESDKTTVEVPALQDGILVEWLVSLEDMVPVESAIARIEIVGEAVTEVKKAGKAKIAKDVAVVRAPASESTKLLGSRPRASTAARASARKSGIDLARIVGTGRGGRIQRADLVQSKTLARATYHVDTPHDQIFVREWPAQGARRGDVLLIHGLFADSQSFVTLGRKLAARGYTVRAVDLPGHGETHSNATTVSEIITAIAATLPNAKPHIIGHSFGAVIATNLAHRAKSLTLLCPGGTGEEINGEFFSAMLAGEVDQALTYLGEKIPLEAVTGLKNQMAVNGSQLKSIVDGIASGNRQTVSILASLAVLSIPVTAVYMRDDAVIPSHHAMNLPQNVSVRFIPGASHLPHWRAPDFIVERLTAAP